MRTILSRAGTPFTTEHTAKLALKHMNLQDAQIVSFNGGFAIQTEDDAPVEVPKKHRATTPWKPASLMGIPEHLKDPAFVYRYCTKEEARPGNIRKKLAEGWEIDKELSRKMAGMTTAPTVHDGTSVDGTFQIREMIVMRMPKEMAEERRKYYAALTDGGAKAVQDRFDNEAGEIFKNADGDRYEGTGVFGGVIISDGKSGT